MRSPCGNVRHGSVRVLSRRLATLTYFQPLQRVLVCVLSQRNNSRHIHSVSLSKSWYLPTGSRLRGAVLDTPDVLPALHVVLGHDTSLQNFTTHVFHDQEA